MPSACLLWTSLVFAALLAVIEALYRLADQVADSPGSITAISGAVRQDVYGGDAAGCVRSRHNSYDAV